MVSLNDGSQRSRLMTSVGQDASRSGNVETFRADLNCSLGRATLASFTFDPYHWSIIVDVMDDDCAPGPTLIAQPPVDDSGDIDIYSIGKVILEQCPEINQSKLFVVFGQLNGSAPSTNTGKGIVHSFNSTVLTCTPNHALQEALVTTDFAGALIDVGILETVDRIITSPWDLWSAFNTSLLAAAPSTLVNPRSLDVHGGYSYDEFISALLTTWSRQPAEYLDHEILLRDSRRLYTATAGQIASRFLRADSTRLVPGSYKTTQLRVTLRGTAFIITEVGLTLLIICTCLMLICSPCTSAPSTSTTLASLAVTIRKTGQLRSQLCGSGKISLDQTGDSLSGHLFSLKGHESFESNSIQLHESETTLRKSSTPAADVVTWWMPVAFSIYVKIAVVTLPLAIIACLEVTYRVSRKGPGIKNAPLNQYWHYAWTWIPASTMTIISLLYSTITWSVALLQPYSILRVRSVVAQRALGQSNLSKPSMELGYQGLRSKHYALLAAAASALLAPLLTIIVSGLILAQSFKDRLEE
jgi:hypothetical protein